MGPQVPDPGVGLARRAGIEERELLPVDGRDDVARLVVDRRVGRAADLPRRPQPGGDRGRDRAARRGGGQAVDADVHRGVGEAGDEDEDHERQQQVHGHAGQQDDRAHLEGLVAEAPRVVRLVAVLSLQPNEAADRQPVQGVGGLGALVVGERPRRQADAELMDAHAGQARHHEVAELVDHHERHQDGQHQHHVDGAVGEVAEVHRLHRAREASAEGPDVGIEGEHLVEARQRRAGRPEAVHGRLAPGARCRGSSSDPARNRSTATSSAAMRAAVARGPRSPARRAMASAGKRASSTGSNVRAAASARLTAWRRRRHAARVGQGVLDRETHVG